MFFFEDCDERIHHRHGPTAATILNMIRIHRRRNRHNIFDQIQSRCTHRIFNRTIHRSILAAVRLVEEVDEVVYGHQDHLTSSTESNRKTDFIRYLLRISNFL